MLTVQDICPGGHCRKGRTNCCILNLPIGLISPGLHVMVTQPHSCHIEILYYYI